MGATRRGGESLHSIRAAERAALREWANGEGRLFGEDPTLSLSRRSSHGEHTVAFDSDGLCWWKITHPGKAGVGAEFDFEPLPPFQITRVFARELLPSEYITRMILHNQEFGDDVRFEGFLDQPEPSLIISQPDIEGTPATKEDMSHQMEAFGYQPLGILPIGKAGSLSFYHPGRRIALFDAHPGNFFRTTKLTIPIDGLISEITHQAEHEWLVKHLLF
ncbi:MAG: hypothetical protein EOP87_02015 [Verrucomicrobiaceae bacterium]|nr:MAG: hypothetical protein EOP87_02015 [Verrucomicrobiaceae bacterium]